MSNFHKQLNVVNSSNEYPMLPPRHVLRIVDETGVVKSVKLMIPKRVECEFFCQTPDTPDI
ncbi:hypothetical protein QQ054_09695 [Oscillatoria amoena NRMC-F 0135]|nr:hypothetical protein [Oscillatoria amoena NRMC-F 0135]